MADSLESVLELISSYEAIFQAAEAKRAERRRLAKEGERKNSDEIVLDSSQPSP